MAASCFFGLAIGLIVGGIFALLLWIFKPESVRYPNRAKWFGVLGLILGVAILLIMVR